MIRALVSFAWREALYRSQAAYRLLEAAATADHHVGRHLLIELAQKYGARLELTE